MNNIINVLDKLTINQISAGEVVEKPSSIVKELVENGLDAKAKSIIVEIKDGGRTYIRVSDDGVGIDESQIEKVFLRHSTSKLKHISDLSSLITNGFRGEALAAISAVSKITLITKYINSDVGNKVVAEESSILSKENFPSSQGTTIIVEDIFYNTPARLKFLKTDSKENLDIIDLLMRMSVASPNIRFKLIIDGKNIFQTLGDGDLLNTISTVYGKSVAKNLIKVKKEIGEGITLEGYISNTSGYSSTKKNQVLQINTRVVKISPLFLKLEYVYKNIIPIRKHPHYFLNIKINSNLIDPNVHPAKLEVKIENSKIVEEHIYQTVKEIIFSSSKHMVPQITLNKNPNEVFEKRDKLTTDTFSSSTYSNDISFLENKADLYQKNTSLSPDYSKYTVSEDKNTHFTLETMDAVIDESFPIDQMHIVTRVFGTYIIAVESDSMYYIDQHAAHERILFENYMEQFKNKKIISQILLVPQILELQIDDYQIFLENIDFINSFGYFCEGFGNKTIVIREVPTLFTKSENENFLIEVINAVKKDEKIEDSEYYKDKVALMACRAAIKANYNLQIEEGNELLKKLSKCQNKYTCPHGRPIFLQLKKKDIEIMFKRIK